MNLDRNQLFNALLSPAAFKQIKNQQKHNFQLNSEPLKLPSIKKQMNSARGLSDPDKNTHLESSQSKTLKENIKVQYSVPKK